VVSGRLTVKVGDRSLAFRLPTSSESENYLAAIRDASEEKLAHSDALCLACCVEGDWAALSEEFPLAVDKIVPALFRKANDAAKEDVRLAIRKWRAAETNLGRMAENLLAFKAYAGGAPTPAQFAGALTVAEWFNVTRGTFRLLEGLMKGLRRRG
jgi:hypothetical protein